MSLGEPSGPGRETGVSLIDVAVHVEPVQFPQRAIGLARQAVSRTATFRTGVRDGRWSEIDGPTVELGI